jgi:hypothetical protein
VDADLDTLVTALYVKIDDGLVKDRRPGHPVQLSHSELVCLAVAQALLGYHSEARWLRFCRRHLTAMFPYLPHQPGYNKRLRAAAAGQAGHPGPGRRQRLLVRRRMDRRFHPGRMRPLPAHRPALGHGRLGELRILRQPFALVLGTAAVPDLHPRRDADPVGTGRPQDRRT